MMLHFTNASTATPMSAGSERIGHLDFFVGGVPEPASHRQSCGPHEELRLTSRGQIDFYAKGFLSRRPRREAFDIELTQAPFGCLIVA
jgi:hypothetical protein